jgi:pyruvate/2-oxoglutarate/acetoin dehydrogenase E1 component
VAELARDPATPISFREAIREGLFEEMQRDERVFVLGEDIAGGAVWGTTRGLHERFPGRVRDTPISESAIVGFSVGAAMSGLRPVPEIMFADLTTVAMDEIVNQAAKMRYMTGGQASVPLVIRIPCGLSKNIGAQGSQALEAWFAHIPGLLVVVPSTPADAKGLIKSAIRSDDPVLFFEYRLLYATEGIVPTDPDLLVPLGKARLLRDGDDLTLISYGRMSALARAASDELEQRDIRVDHVDLRSLVPFDEETVLGSVERTGRVLIVEEACERVSFGAWVASRIQERSFDALRGPIRRVASLNAPKPVAPPLESFVFPDVSRIVRAAEDTVAGTALRGGAFPDYWISAARERS